LGILREKQRERNLKSLGKKTPLTIRDGDREKSVKFKKNYIEIPRGRKECVASLKVVKRDSQRELGEGGLYSGKRNAKKGTNYLQAPS